LQIFEADFSLDGYAMPEIDIVRAIKPKKGMHITEGRGEYIGKHPYGEGASGFWVGFKIMWRGRFFASQSGLLVLPDFCLGVPRISDRQTTSEVRWSAFSSSPAGRAGAVRGGALGGALGGAVGGLLGGGIAAAFAQTKGLSGFAVYYNNEVQSTGGFLAAAKPDIVDEIFSVMPDDKIIPLPE
jgi:hypothetical protein